MSQEIFPREDTGTGTQYEPALFIDVVKGGHAFHASVAANSDQTPQRPWPIVRDHMPSLLTVQHKVSHSSAQETAALHLVNDSYDVKV
jgi:hypothetical protein